MTKPLDVLNAVRIASPCPVLWDDMTGDDRVRHCRQCDCRVYNLSTVTAEEGVKILRETEGRLCIQLWRRADGTLITTDCPVGLRERARRLRRRLAAFAASIASYLALPGCTEEPVNNYGPPLPSGAVGNSSGGTLQPKNSSAFARSAGIRATGGYVCRPDEAEAYRAAQKE